MGSYLHEEDFAMEGTLLCAELPSGSLRSVYAALGGADVARRRIAHPLPSPVVYRIVTRLTSLLAFRTKTPASIPITGCSG